MDARFNIFSLIGLIIIFSNFFIAESSLVSIALLIALIPDINKGIANYKNTGKINSILIYSSIVLVFLIIILASKLFKF
jgi:hypothetical protein